MRPPRRLSNRRRSRSRFEVVFGGTGLQTCVVVEFTGLETCATRTQEMSTRAAEPRTSRTAPPVDLPRRSAWLFRGFRKYCAWYVRKHFHALRVSNTSAPFPPPTEPVLIV